MIVKMCDRCGNVVNDVVPKVGMVEVRRIMSCGPVYPLVYENVDLCENCYGVLERWIQKRKSDEDASPVRKHRDFQNNPS